MSTLRNKVALLAQSQNKIFRSTDLAILWNIENKNTLSKTILRYTKRNLLYRIYKGLYSIIPLSKLNNYEIACAIGGPFSYISGETILEKEGLIMQKVNQITFFGSKAKSLQIEGINYLCRYMNPKYLLNRTGIKDSPGISIASAERAVADIQHLNPHFYIDNTIAINFDNVDKLAKEIGYNDSTK